MIHQRILEDDELGEGSSLKDGEIELIIHRRILEDDARGVAEALDELGEDGEGLEEYVTHYLLFSDDCNYLFEFKILFLQ